MERQLQLDLTDPAELSDSLRKYMAPLGLSLREVAALCVIVGRGTREVRGTDQLSRLQCTRAQAGEWMQASPNTWWAAVQDLEAAGLVAVVRVTKPWTVFANWSRVAKLEPPPEDPTAGMDLFPPSAAFSDQARSTPDQPDRDSVSSCTSKVRGISVFSRDSVSVMVPAGGERWRRPWDRQAGIGDADLVAAVTGGRGTRLRRLYDEAVLLGWITDSDQAELDFLVVCHHCATCQKLTKSRMGALVKRVQAMAETGRIRTEGTRQASDQWAARMIAARHRDPQLAGERRTLLNRE